MSHIPNISEEDIRDLVGSQSFQRGQQYFRSGAIFNPRRQGMTLKAHCQGSDVYDVQVTFDTNGVTEADCSCPVGYCCKHVAALLLTWLAQSEEFLEQEEIDTALAQLSQAELMALVKKMVRRMPELESLLPLTRQQQQANIQPEMYRRNVENIFRNGGNRWGATASIADKLLEIQDTADEFADQQNYVAALTIYEYIAQGIFQHYEEYDDESGNLANTLDASVEAMDNWLDEVKDSASLRERMLRLLFDIYHFDVEAGGVGIGQDAPTALLNHATGGERQIVVNWIRDALSIKGGETYHLNWRNQCFGRLLLELQADALDDETFLHTSREAGLTSNVIERLLKLGRIDEAAKEVEHVSDHEMTAIADLFVQHEQETLAESIVQGQYRQSHNWLLREWLKQRYLTREDYTSAFALAQEQFQQSSSLQSYQELRQLAQQLGHWETLRPTLLANLKQPQQSNLLIQIALDEGDVDRALSLVKAQQQPLSGYTYGYSISPVALQVAVAAEKRMPLAAIDIYRHQVDWLIAQRNRGNYAEACTFLLKIRLLYTRLNATEEWTNYLTLLRDKYRNLRALRDEMTTAGVLA